MKTIIVCCIVALINGSSLPAFSQSCENLAYQYLQRPDDTTTRKLFGCLEKELGIQNSKVPPSADSEGPNSTTQRGTLAPEQGAEDRPLGSENNRPRDLLEEEIRRDIYRDPKGEFRGGGWG
ncbi:hypothetical protein [Roseibium sp. M-1]